jgi:flagellar basal body-associated protein FliL
VEALSAKEAQKVAAQKAYITKPVIIVATVATGITGAVVAYYYYYHYLSSSTATGDSSRASRKHVHANSGIAHGKPSFFKEKKSDKKVPVKGPSEKQGENQTLLLISVIVVVALAALLILWFLRRSRRAAKSGETE